MKVKLSVNNREYELIKAALIIAANYIRGILTPFSLSPDEIKMLAEEHLNLIKKLENIDGIISSGIYINGNSINVTNNECSRKAYDIARS